MRAVDNGGGAARGRRLRACFLCCVYSGLLWPPLAVADLFDEVSPLQLRLSGPLNAVLKDRKERRAWPFHLSVEGEELEVSVRVRGNSRAEICEFPPLRLDFRGSDTRGTAFAGHGKIKMVTHCRNRKSGTGNVLEEYAAYRIFNLLTDVSFRVRLLRIHYADSIGTLHERASPNYAFLIEPAAHLSGRVGGAWARLPGVRKSQLDVPQALLVYVFQYLIGNTDWSLVAPLGDPVCCHNGDLLEKGDRLFVVPFDFDLAGLVNASYAEPDASLHIKKVTTRRYRGYCMGKDALRDTIRHIVSRKEEILAVLSDLPNYARRDLKRTSGFLEDFFTKARDEESLAAYFEARCLG